MGDTKPITTQGIYAHRFNTDDHADAIAAVGHPAVHRDNVIPLHGWTGFCHSGVIGFPVRTSSMQVRNRSITDNLILSAFLPTQTFAARVHNQTSDAFDVNS